jgi:hypothetical protein
MAAVACSAASRPKGADGGCPCAGVVRPGCWAAGGGFRAAVAPQGERRGVGVRYDARSTPALAHAALMHAAQRWQGALPASPRPAPVQPAGTLAPEGRGAQYQAMSLAQAAKQPTCPPARRCPWQACLTATPAPRRQRLRRSSCRSCCTALWRARSCTTACTRVGGGPKAQRLLQQWWRWMPWVGRTRLPLTPAAIKGWAPPWLRAP